MDLRGTCCITVVFNRLGGIETLSSHTNMMLRFACSLSPHQTLVLQSTGAVNPLRVVVYHTRLKFGLNRGCFAILGLKR